MLQGYGSNPQQGMDQRFRTTFEGLTSPATKPMYSSKNQQGRSRGLVYEDYSDGEISLIIDEDLKRSPTTVGDSRRQMVTDKRSAAREIFGEGDSTSNDMARREDRDRKGFRIKKDSRGLASKQGTLTSHLAINPMADVANLTGGLTKYKMLDLESNFKKNRLDSYTDQNVRDTRQVDFRKTTMGFTKDAAMTDKLKKQLEIEKELRTKYTSFHGQNQTPTEEVRSSSHNLNRFQNNFMRNPMSSQQQARTSLGPDRSGDDDRNPARNTQNNFNLRNYDKPWLMNSNNRPGAEPGLLQASATQTVPFVLTQNWLRPSSNKKEAAETPPSGPPRRFNNFMPGKTTSDKFYPSQGLHPSSASTNPPVSQPNTTTASDPDFPDFFPAGSKREAYQSAGPKENSTSLKNNLESRETAENRSEEKDKTSRRLLNYEVGSRLGKGSYATVHEAVDTATGNKCAIKTYEKAKMNSKTRRTIIEREIQVLNCLEHPRLIRLHKVIQTKNHVASAYFRSTS